MKQVVAIGVCVLAVAAACADDPPIRQDRRYLSVKNDTADKLVVFVQYETFVTSVKGWRWFPGEPDQDKAVAYSVPAGKTVKLQHDDWPLNARRVRIWATGEDGASYDEYREQDLWLVEKQNDGERYYMSAAGETFTFTFGK